MKATPEQIQTALINLVKDCLYKLVRMGKTNAEIQAYLKKKRMPFMAPEKINIMREHFKECEAKAPEKMAEFRRRLSC
jgi:hypothetical protein